MLWNVTSLCIELYRKTVIQTNKYMNINPRKKTNLVILSYWMKRMLAKSRGKKENCVSSKKKRLIVPTCLSWWWWVGGKKKERNVLITKSLIWVLSDMVGMLGKLWILGWLGLSCALNRVPQNSCLSHNPWCLGMRPCL